MKTNIPSGIVTLVLLCFGVFPKAQAVNPAPDGGYPGFNTAEGENALFSLTSGTGNTGLGWYSLHSNTTAGFNTAVGAGALTLNNAAGNTAVGTVALFLNTTGIGNTAVGTNALVYNDTGDNNNAVGSSALYGNDSGSFNNAFGDNALVHNVSGSFNTAVGDAALFNSAGDFNIALGIGAGSGLHTGNNNIYIGNLGAEENDTIRIGSGQTSAYISGIFGATVLNGVAVLVSADGALGTLPSSRRFKRDIQPMDKTSEAILALKPIAFHYKSDKSSTLQFGLIAEEVAKVNPDLVVRDKDGEIYTVRYDAVNAMLLNEFLKEHRKVDKLETDIAQQRKHFEAAVGNQQQEIERLAATVNGQAALIQKMSDKIKFNKTTSRVVLSARSN